MKKIIIYLALASRVLVGIVFLFSGFVKGVDPTGFMIKLEEYFSSIGLNSLQSLALILAMLLSTAEFLIGACLFFGIRMHLAAWGALLFMAVFTPLTLVLALFNPVSDCGCFGDALVLTNWQTFYKNIVITILVIFLFVRRNHYQPWLSMVREWIAAALILSFFLVFSIHSYRHLPMLDFRPFHVGSFLPGKMTVPENAEPPEFVTTLIYEKNGIRKEFGLDNYPWQDSTWHWVETITHEKSRGYLPPIHDFSITGPDGMDITDIVLALKTVCFLMVSPDLGKANKKAMSKVNELYLRIEQAGYKFYFLTSATTQRMNETRKEYNLVFPFCSTDETVLKTMIRSNPGLVALQGGTVIGHWHYHDLPDPALLASRPLAAILNQQRIANETLVVISFALGLCLIIALVRMIPTRVKT
jgi:uncharacterized membrane protein YphA (DoxX/SURF4 family)